MALTSAAGLMPIYSGCVVIVPWKFACELFEPDICVNVAGKGYAEEKMIICSSSFHIEVVGLLPNL